MYKRQLSGLCLSFYGMILSGIAEKSENIPLNTGKQQHHKRHGHNGTQSGHYVDCAGICLLYTSRCV